MAQSDLDTLLEMGFDKERAELAVKESGGCKSSLKHTNPSLHTKVQGALEWLENNQDKPLDGNTGSCSKRSSIH